MTPVQKLKKHIIEVAIRMSKKELGIQITADNIDDVFDDMQENEMCDYMCDAISEVRCSGEETNLRAIGSRHYESSVVALKIDDTWIGWTYFYGGGKHSDPDAMPWIEDAYEVTCETVMKPVNVFKKV